MVHNPQKYKKEPLSYFKQIQAPFKIYPHFECNLKCIEVYEGSYSKKYQKHILAVLLTKLFVLIGFVSQLLFLEVEMLLMNLL